MIADFQHDFNFQSITICNTDWLVISTDMSLDISMLHETSIEH